MKSLDALQRKSQDSLDQFVSSMAKFDRMFCDAIASGEDFTIRLEVRGDQGNLLHVRVSTEGFLRPPAHK